MKQFLYNRVSYSSGFNTMFCKIKFSFLVILISAITSNSLLAQRNYTALVNPFIGTGGHGHTYPGASMPFGMMQLSPDTREANWDGSSGYHYSDSTISGFSHTHLSGTGIPDYCDVLLMPFTGPVQWNKESYGSGFSHKKEKASPGYYSVFLDKYRVNAELTTSTRSGMHQYRFPEAGKKAGLMIDLLHRDPLLDVFIEKIDQHEVRGFRRSRSWAQDQVLYFHIRSEQPFYTETLEDSVAGRPVVTKMALSFIVPADKMVRFKIGISAVSMEGAAQNLAKEIPDWNFDLVKRNAEKAWNTELGKIEIKGGTSDQQVVFYTALYHTFLAPNIFQDVDGKYRGTDGKVHVAKDFTNYTVFSLWDTYRAYHPLMTILNQQRTTDWIHTFLQQYKNGGMLPVWELAGNETFCMIGYHSVPVIVDAYQKGIRNFNTALALEAMRSYAESSRFGLDHYRENGYIPNDKEHESVSKTLEYAYDDWCIAQYAKMLNADSVYQQYMQRAQYYKNVFDPSTKHMRGKVGALWHAPFDPREINNFYTEGNAWHYSFAVPQDIRTLIQLHGGEDAFVSRLEELFTTSSQTTGRNQADVTGLIGQYAQGNEPSHHMAYLFNYVGKPWRTQELVHQICNGFYTNVPDGLIGNEDCGQMSAWYIFSAMGFYPVCPGNGEYVLSTPLFDEVTLHLENGKRFTISAKRQTKTAKYINSVTLNKKPYTKSYLLHSDLMAGGRFDFVLRNLPDTNWGTREIDQPHSRIEAEEIVPVPFFNTSGNKFRDSLVIGLSHIDPAAVIWQEVREAEYSLGAEPHSLNELRVDTTAFVSTYATKNGKRSQTIVQQFHKLPSDKTIRVLSKVHPMYTAGGDDALIDGIKGDVNWRSGVWQSYFDQDFEAVIDLQHKKKINYVGVQVLQDISPWIRFPQKMIVYTSNDGVNFEEAGFATTEALTQMEPVSTKEIGCKLTTAARYVRIRLINGGKLPSWHESAGEGSHLFLSEIIVN